MFLYIKNQKSDSDIPEGLIEDLGLTRDLDEYDSSRKNARARKSANHKTPQYWASDILTAARTIA